MNYPARPQNGIFAVRWLRTALSGHIPKDLGPSVIALLTAIVLEEDRLRYRRCAEFSDAELADCLGVTIRTLHTVRKASVDGGALMYEPARKGIPALYYVVEHPRKILPTIEDIPGKVFREPTETGSPSSEKSADKNSKTCRAKRTSSAKSSEKTKSRYIEEFPNKNLTKTLEEPGGSAAGSSATSDEPAPKTEEKKPRERWPMFDAIARLSGQGKSAPGRIAALARKIEKAGIDADTLLDRLPTLVRLYASWRKTIDLDTITACWGWIIDPPAVAEKPMTKGDQRLVDAAKGAAASGKKRPY